MEFKKNLKKFKKKQKRTFTKLKKKFTHQNVDKIEKKIRLCEYEGSSAENFEKWKATK